MPIQVTCPGCLKRFQVADKFAGKTGPCPNCSKPITIPAKTEEVVIHSPEAAGPKDAKGRPIFKPIRRTEVKITLPIALSAAAVAVVAIGVAMIVRFTTTEPPTPLLVLGAMLLAPPIVLVGYWFLRDDELEGYQGTELFVRCGIVSLVFMVTWGLYALVPMYIGGFSRLSEIETSYLLFIVPAMVVIGAAASTLALELETAQGSMHYLLYFAVTLFLALLMGTEIARPFASSSNSSPRAPATNTAPNTSAGSASPANTKQTPSNSGAPLSPKPSSGGRKSPLMQ